MAKMTAEEFLSPTTSKTTNKREVGQMTADEFFSLTTKEYEDRVKKDISVGSSDIINKTLQSVTKPTAIKPVTTQQAATTPAAGFDFKSVQAADLAAKNDPFAGKTLAPINSLPNNIQDTLKGKVPAASLIQQTGGGPANASQIPGISEYSIGKKKIEEGNAPAAVKAYANAMNYLAFGNPIGVGISRSFAGNSGATRRDSTGNAAVDKITDLVNNLVTPFITPTGAPIGAGPNVAPYKAANQALNTKLGMQYTNYLGNSLLRRGLVPKGSASAANSIARNTIAETIAGPLQNVGAGLINGQDSNQEIATNAQFGLAGGALGFAGSFLGELMSKSGLSRAEIAEIAPDQLALPQGSERLTRKAQAGNVNNLGTNTDSVVNTYTFGLDEASPSTINRSANATEGRTAVSEIDQEIYNLNTKYEQAVIDEYKALKEHRDNPRGVQQGELYFDSDGNVTGRRGRLSNNDRWYQEAMKENNYQRLSNKKLYELARKHTDEGFDVESGRVPSWKQENNYDEQLFALTAARENLQQSVREIDPALNVTDSPLKTDVLKDTRKGSTTSKPKTEIKPKTELKPKVEPSAPKTEVKKEVAATAEVKAVPKEVSSRDARIQKQMDNGEFISQEDIDYLLSKSPEEQQIVQPKKEIKPKAESEIEKLDKELKAYKDLREQQVTSGYLDREQASKQIKGRAMEIAAQKREIIQGDLLIPVEGGLTTKELQAKISRLQSNYKGKPVLVDGKEGKIKSNAFGKVVVEFPDGTTKAFDPEDVVPKTDVNALIAKQTQSKVTTLKPKTEIKPKEATLKPKTELKLNNKVAATTELAPVKAEVSNKPATVEKAKKTKEYEPKTEGIRSNYKTMTDSENISPALKSKIDELDQTYQVSKNADVVATSNEAIKELSKVESEFLSSGSTGAQHISNGYRVMQELDKAGEHARALSVADKLAKDLTTAGQTVQAASLISRLSPEGQLLNLVRVAEKNGKVVELADSVKFKELATKVQENTGAGIKENAISDILTRLEKGGASAEDIKALGDYIKSAESKIKAKPVKDKLPKELNDVKKRDKVISFLEAQEAAAQARINKRRGRLNSLPVEEWIDYSIIISSKVAKGVIKAETYVEDLVKLFGEDIKPLARDIFEKAQELVGSVAKGSIEGDFLKANKAFKRITGTDGLNQQERIVEKYVLANPEVTTKDIEYLRKLSKSLTELQGTNKIKADMEMQKILNSYEKSSINDKINAVRYMAMLFNDSTQAINALSGPIMATWGSTIDVLGTMLDIAMRGTFKSKRSTTLYGTNPLRFMADYFKYAKIGGKAGWEGVNPSGIQGTNEIRGLAFKSKKNPLGLIERSLGAVAKGADYATYKTIYQSELQKQGFLDALENGIKRSDKEGIKAHVRKFMNDPPIEAMEQADRIGKNTTFQRGDSVGGKTANWINSAPKGVKPVVNAVVPFVRTPLNIASSAVTATPVGIIKGLFQLSSLSKASQREALRTLSMGITGSAGVSSLGYYLSSLGIITGSNDTGNKDVNNINEQAGRGKYRFNTSALKRYMSAFIAGEGAEAAEKAAKYQKGDKQFDYNKLQPLAFPLAIGAGYQEKNGNVGVKLGAAGTDAFGSLFGMSSLKGIQDTFQPQYTGSQGDKAIKVPMRIVESYFKSFSPSILAQEARRQDPIQRKTAYNEGLKKDLTTYYASRLPILSKTLPKNKDTLGNDKRYPEGVLGQHVNPYKSEVANYSVAAEFLADVIERTGDKTVAPKAPDKKISGYDENDEKQEITIPTKRYEQLQEETGAEITRRIIEIESDNDDEIIEEIKNIYEEVKAEQKEKLREEFNLYSK